MLLPTRWYSMLSITAMVFSTCYFIGYLIILFTDSKDKLFLRQLCLLSVSYGCAIIFTLLGTFLLLVPLIPRILRLSPVDTPSQLLADKIVIIGAIAYIGLLLLILIKCYKAVGVHRVQQPENDVKN